MSIINQILNSRIDLVIGEGGSGIKPKSQKLFVPNATSFWVNTNMFTATLFHSQKNALPIKLNMHCDNHLVTAIIDTGFKSTLLADQYV